MTLEEVEDLTWAEFLLRSYGFKEEREFQLKLAREQAYQTFGLPWRVFGKRPPSKDKFWPMDGKNKISDETLDTLNMLREMKKKKNGNS